MTADPLRLMAEVDRATDRLMRTAAALDDAAVAAPSALPGWSRGHVLTHVARNADAYVNLLTWARTGEVTPAYRDAAQREADIAAGASRARAEQLADLRAAAARFAAAADEMPPEAWTAELTLRNGPKPAAVVVWHRLREVEVHHVDLAAGYAPADWPEAFSHRLLHELVADLGGWDSFPPLVLDPAETGHILTLGEPDGAPTASGPAWALAGWLAGRTKGEEIILDPVGLLPAPPPWK
ncbi:MAG TPA: maleylpyruvate isomerase family mycothiol-dependent enzyme [Micromonospora sp.]|nr:maleylpyruvate isomerase family mycothiol-dependent enzyme [Micromonospora sp.]